MSGNDEQIMYANAVAETPTRSQRQSWKQTRERIPTKTQWALMDIQVTSVELQEHHLVELREAIMRLQGDRGPALALLDEMRQELARIERCAKVAQEGGYTDGRAGNGR